MNIHTPIVYTVLCNAGFDVTITNKGFVAARLTKRQLGKDEVAYVLDSEIEDVTFDLMTTTDGWVLVKW